MKARGCTRIEVTYPLDEGRTFMYAAMLKQGRGSVPLRYQAWSRVRWLDVGMGRMRLEQLRSSVQQSINFFCATEFAAKTDRNALKFSETFANFVGDEQAGARRRRWKGGGGGG